MVTTAKLAINVYQGLSEFKTGLLYSVFGYASVCRHQPSCSQYTLQQIEDHGTIIGLWRGLNRVLRCW